MASRQQDRDSGLVQEEWQLGGRLGRMRGLVGDPLAAQHAWHDHTYDFLRLRAGQPGSLSSSQIGPSWAATWRWPMLCCCSAALQADLLVCGPANQRAGRATVPCSAPPHANLASKQRHDAVRPCTTDSDSGRHGGALTLLNHLASRGLARLALSLRGLRPPGSCVEPNRRDLRSRLALCDTHFRV